MVFDLSEQNKGPWPWNRFLAPEINLKPITKWRLAVYVSGLEGRVIFTKYLRRTILHIFDIDRLQKNSGKRNRLWDCEKSIRPATESVQEIRNSLKTIQKKFQKRSYGRISVRWNALRTCRFDKILCKSSDHNLQSSHVNRMGISNDHTCRKCREDMRLMLEHLLYFCPDLSRTRLSYSGGLQLKRLDEVSKWDIQSLLYHI